MAFTNDEQDKNIADLKAKQEEDRVHELAGQLDMPYVDLTGISINTDALRLVPESEIGDWDDPDPKKKLEKEKLIKLRMAPYNMVGKKLSVAVQSPAIPEVRAKIAQLEHQGWIITEYLASMRSLRKAWGRYHDISLAETGTGGLLDISDASLQTIVASVKTNADVKTQFEKILALKDVHQVSHLMEIIFGSAIATKSSDIHFEAQEKQVRIRFRQDGVLQDIIYFDHALYKRFISRIKLLSEMKITISETAQDGRFSIKYKNQAIEIRVSTVPGPYGEGIVMRILNPDSIALSFEELGIEPALFKVLDREIRKPNGMVLTTGPTGSGKTTTLYAFLKRLYTPEVKVMTIEDPIEYHLEGVNQTQVEHDKGYDFLAGLRAALRQDPDIIMVGEIRDKETATIAVNASLTGHMVLSTLHTNNAAGTIPRLLDLGIKPGILSAALTVSMAQRLVRKLCPACKKKIEMNPDQESVLRSILSHAERVGKKLDSYSVSSKSAFELYGPVGCTECNMVGYKGRVGLYEAILTDDTIAKMMNDNPSERDIKRAADRQGILTMVEDGAIKIITGITSIEEVQSVVDLYEDEPLRKESAEKSGVPLESLGTQPADRLPVAVGNTTSPETNTLRPVTSRSWQSHELALLVDYLKLLEQHQTQHPDMGIAHKIEDAEKTILEVLKHSNPDSMFVPSVPSATEEIQKIMSDLAQLKADQEKNPSVSVAEKLAELRNSLENLQTSG